MKRVARRLRRIANAAIGRDIFVKLDIERAVTRLGSNYGGWYFSDMGINRSSVIYSAGVGEDISFDLALMHQYGVILHAFDPTPRSIEWLRRQPLSSDFILHEYGLADCDGVLSFCPPANTEHVSHSIFAMDATNSHRVLLPVKRLKTIMAELRHTHIDVLKMDIEGAEYGVIADMQQSGVIPGQVLVEFHHRFRSVGAQKSREAIERLRSMGYALYAVSDTGEEYSFALQRTTARRR